MKLIFNKLYRAIQVLGLRKPYYRSARRLNGLFRQLGHVNQGVGLDLGSGPTPRNPFAAPEIHGVDIRANETNKVHPVDISLDMLPFEDSTIDFITAYDVLEHVPRVTLHEGRTGFPLIILMNEVFRVLKPGGVFFNMQPCFPFREAFQDPTHVNIMTEDTLYLYFCEPSWARIYGFEGSFVMIEDGWHHAKYFSFLKKSNMQPIRDMEFLQK